MPEQSFFVRTLNEQFEISVRERTKVVSVRLRGIGIFPIEHIKTIEQLQSLAMSLAGCEL